MIRSIKHFSKRFYVYQNERFPIVLLVLSLLPATLSSAAVVYPLVSVHHMILAAIASLVYIFHIRVNDEERDFEHDSVHHSKRPLHRGDISLNDLKILNAIGICIFVLIATLSGTQAILIGLIMITYSYVAKYDFFCKEKIRNHFFIYNIAHIVQILLMQIFVYAVIARTIPFSSLLLVHFLFTMTGTIIFEFARKVKIPGDDGTGKDTYTHHIGFNKSLTVYSGLSLLNTALFSLILVLINHGTLILVYIFVAVIAIAGSIWLHWIRKTVMTDKLMQGMFLLMYAVYNISIFILIH
jgi:4-hydroxybenzoate polyprenyltransferase